MFRVNNRVILIGQIPRYLYWKGQNKNGLNFKSKFYIRRFE